MKRNAIWLYLIAFLIIYLGPLYIIYLGGVIFKGFESRLIFIDGVMKFVITDQSNQELFVRIIMPLLVGITSGNVIKNMVSLPSVFISLIFIVSFAIASLLLIDLGMDDVKTLLGSRDISIDKLIEFTISMREALITSLTITLGISASKKKKK